MHARSSSRGAINRSFRLQAGVAATALLAGLLTATLTTTYLFDDHARQFEQTAENNRSLLRQAIEEAPPAGAARSLGLTNLRAVEQLRRDDQGEDPSLARSLTALRDALAADLVYVMNTDGTVVACSPYGDGDTLTGNNYAFRAYFLQALAGHPNVDIALGVTTDQRGLYFAAPVIEPEGPPEILGVAVVKAPMRALDEQLAGMHAIAMLVAPDNTVFAANRPDLIMQPFAPGPDGPLVHEQGVRYVRFEAPIQFESGPAGWRVAFLDPVGGWVPPFLPVSAGAGAAAVTGLLLSFLLRWETRWQRRAERLTRTRDELHHKVQESREQVRRLAVAVDQVAESILITGTDGIITYANPYLLEHTGYTRQELIGAHVRLFKSGHHDDAFYRRLWETLAAGRVWRGRFINRKKDGTTFEEDAVITPIRMRTDGPVTGFVAVKRDITATQLLEREVRESQKMAAIGQLAHKVAHDFTNMLVVIMGHAEMARKELAASPQLKAHAEAILEAVNRITPLTTELMVFAQPATIEPRRMDLAHALDGMTAMLRDLAPASAAVAVEAPAGCGQVCIDPGMLEQALVHLAVNAFEAMPHGGTFTVATHPVAPGADVAVITVRDTGRGINPADLDHVFEPFFTTKSDRRNAGLGLSTVYRIVTRHDGQVTVASEPDRGTTFTIRLPLA